MADPTDHPRRSFVKRSAGAGLLATGFSPGSIARSSDGLGAGPDRESIATVTRTEPFRAVRSRLRDRGFRPRMDDASTERIGNPDTGETGTLVRFPFASPGAVTAVAFGFVDERGTVRVVAGVYRDGDLVLEFYSDERIAAADGVLRRTHVPPEDLGDHLDPAAYREAARDRGVGVRALYVPGYAFVGSYDLGDICYVVSGACFGLFLASLADLLPGDEALVGASCGVAGGACWIVDTARRYAWCADPDVVLYVRAWWNPIGPRLLGYPTC